MITYFKLLDLLVERFQKIDIKAYLTLFYFPLLILIYANFLNKSMLISDFSGIFISIVAILIYIILSPSLIIPSWNELKGIDFFAYKNFYNCIDKVELPIIDSNLFLNEKTQEFNESRAVQNHLFVFKKTFFSNITSGVYYKPNYIISKYKRSKLRELYKNEGKSYFDILDFKADYFIELISMEKWVLDTERIQFYPELKGFQIYKFLREINKITKIPIKKLCNLFFEINSDGKPKKLNYNSLKSSYNQYVRDVKVNK